MLLSCLSNAFKIRNFWVDQVSNLQNFCRTLSFRHFDFEILAISLTLSMIVNGPIKKIIIYLIT